MLYFWLGLSIVSAISITYFGFIEGFDRWIYYYVVPVIALLMFFFKRYMVQRMEKHFEYLDEQKRKNQK